MKITDVSVTLWEWQDIPPTRYTKTVASSGTRSTQMGLLRIRTDDGIEGHGFLGSAMGSARYDAPYVVDAFKKMLVGQDPLNREHIWQSLMRRTRSHRMPVVGAIDVALWDLAGKAAGMPIHKLMGSFRDKIPAYASSAVLDRPEDYAEEAVKFKEANWAAYKIHPHGSCSRPPIICVVMCILKVALPPA